MPKASKMLFPEKIEPLPYDEEAMRRMRAAAQVMGPGGMVRVNRPANNRPAPSGKSMAYVMGAKRG